MSEAAALLIAFAIYLLGVTTGLRWSRRVFPRYRDRNPFGELPSEVDGAASTATEELAQLVAGDLPLSHAPQDNALGSHEGRPHLVTHCQMSP